MALAQLGAEAKAAIPALTTALKDVSVTVRASPALGWPRGHRRPNLPCPTSSAPPRTTPSRWSGITPPCP